MADHAKVLNLFNKCRIKRSQARRLVEQCAYAWVDDRSIRKLSLAEMVKARSEQARLNEPMPFAEIPGLIFEHNGAGGEMRIAREANLWATNRTWLIEEMQ